jgi:hypothetical protein
MHDAINICESDESPEVKRSLGARVESAFTVAALFAVRFTSLAARVRTREKFENGRRNRLPHQRKSFVCKGRIGFSLSILAAIPIFSQLLSSTLSIPDSHQSGYSWALRRRDLNFLLSLSKH